MKKIAVWGNGLFGRQMQENLRRFWGGEAAVTAVYDRKAGFAEGAGLPVRDPSLVGEDFRAGLFEAVMIAVWYEPSYCEIEEILAAEKIPVFRTGKAEDFAGPEAFPRKDTGLSVTQPGYELCVFEELYGVTPVYPKTDTMFLFGRNGKTLSWQWDAYHMHDGFTHMYDFPVRFRDYGGPVRDIPGQTCVLAKLWSGNYSHFTFESMDCAELLEEAGYTGRYLIGNAPWDKELLRMAGVDEARILTLDDIGIGTVVRFEEAVCLKLRENDRALSAPVLARFAGKIRAGLEKDPEHKKYPARLFVKRVGQRRLLDAEWFVEKYGFETIIPEELSVREQMTYFANADIILSPHGANSATALYMHPGAVMIETFGRSWVNYMYMHAIAAVGAWHLPVVQGPIMPPHPTVKFEDYRIGRIQLETAMRQALVLQGHPAGT